MPATTIGPIMRELWNCAEFSAMPFISDSRGTRSGSSDWHAGT